MAERKLRSDPLIGSLFDELPDVELPALELPAGFPVAWAPAVGAEFGKPYFVQLSAFLRDERALNAVFPSAADVYTALVLTPPERVSVVILGQDPYPTPGHAHGLAFSVRPGVGLPASLRNIYRELHDDLGIPPASQGSLTTWAAQGVLLLNAVLTVRSGVPNSHANRGWETFTDAVLAAVNAGPPVVFVLWGNYAQKKAKRLDGKKHVILKTVHPSPLSAARGFFGSRIFTQINTALECLGRPAVDWKLPTTA